MWYPPILGLGGWGLVLQGKNSLKALLGRETVSEKLFQSDQEGVGGEDFLEPHPVTQIGELQGDLEVGRHLSKYFQLLELGVAHLGLDLKEQLAQTQEVVFPFPVFPVLVPEIALLLLADQGGVGDDFAHGLGSPGENVTSRLADLHKKG